MRVLMAHYYQGGSIPRNKSREAVECNRSNPAIQHASVDDLFAVHPQSQRLPCSGWIAVGSPGRDPSGRVLVGETYRRPGRAVELTKPPGRPPDGPRIRSAARLARQSTVNR